MTLVLFSNRGHYNACVGHYYACVDIWLCVCAVCATCTCVRGFVCWHPTFQLFGSAFVCWNATFQLFFFCSATCCCCCIMSVSHRPSSSQALYFVAATVQQQSHMKLFLLCWPRTVHLCVRVRAIFPIGTAHILERCKDAAQRAGRYNATINYYFLGISKATAQPRYNGNGITAVQRHQRFQRWPL